VDNVNIKGSDDVTAVNIRARSGYARVMTGTRYHHGNLRPALVEAAVGLAREQGPDGLVLREVARRVGVSHNAAYRHFTDRDELIEEVARHGLDELVRAAQQRLDGVVTTEPVRRARRRLAELGRGYVDFALAEPGLFRVVFVAYPAVADRDDGGRDAPTPDPLQMLCDCLDDLVEVGWLAPERRSDAEISCWSAVHGFAVLHIDGPLRGSDPAARDAALTQLVTAIDRGYGATTGQVVDMDDLVNDR
jgi:AcrR family transcriptional regulator